MRAGSPRSNFTTAAGKNFTAEGAPKSNGRPLPKPRVQQRREGGGEAGQRPGGEEENHLLAGELVLGDGEDLLGGFAEVGGDAGWRARGRGWRRRRADRGLSRRAPAGAAAAPAPTPSNTVSYQARAAALRQLKVWGSNTTHSGRSGKCRAIASIAERAFS